MRPAAACLQDTAVRSAVGEGLALCPLGAHQRAAAVGKARVDVHRRGALYHTDTHARITARYTRARRDRARETETETGRERERQRERERESCGGRGG
eukprot:COSAG03_NODE_6496_length_1051_cov_1.670168_1_plen_96_part_10